MRSAWRTACRPDGPLAALTDRLPPWRLGAAVVFQAQVTVAELQAQLDLLKADADQQQTETEDVAQLKVRSRTPRPSHPHFFRAINGLTS